MREDIHRFKGLNKLAHPINQNPEFLCDARNIRLTSRDNNTFLSLTNERSTKALFYFNKNKDELYIGHSTIDTYIVLFTHSEDGDYIYRIDCTNTDEPKVVILYSGKLGFSNEYSIQAVSDYEAKLIQKIYWIDGYNTPRMINIAKPELLEIKNPPITNGLPDYTKYYNDAPFNFISDLALEEEVTVEPSYSNVGLFPSGVIQYAFTYCYKYGQESNIFYTTELFNIKFPDRGASPEEKVGISFNITIKNIETKFDYIRVYSILRTSIDATPTVKRVTDIPINRFILPYVTFSDNNTTGNTVDPYYLLYLGGHEIIPQCMATKDNVLFFGNITYKRNDIKNVKINDESIISDYRLNKDYIKLLELVTDTEDKEYKGKPTFKIGETYRLGCRFQHTSGVWSEPVWIKDFVYRENEKGISLDENYKPQYIEAAITDELYNALNENKYKKVQALIAKPENKDRTILAQGIIAPTVGMVSNRANQVGCYAQSSWLWRPYHPKDTGDYMHTCPAYEHNESLYIGAGRNVELQNMAIDASWNSKYTYDELALGIDENKYAYYGFFAVDQSIVTFHSPEIEFGNIGNILKAGSDKKLIKRGSAFFDKNTGKVSIQTDTPPINPQAGGVIEQGFFDEGYTSLIANPFYEDSRIININKKDETDKNNTTDANKVNYEEKCRLWLVYMWHRSGSLNNDTSRVNDTGIPSAKLKKKSFLNTKSALNTSLDTVRELDVIDMQEFNSNEVSMIKLKARVIESTNGIIQTYNQKIINYYGNINTLVPTYTSYNIVATHINLINSLPESLGTKLSFSFQNVEDAEGHTVDEITVDANIRVYYSTGTYYNNRDEKSKAGIGAIFLSSGMVEDSNVSCTFKVDGYAVTINEGFELMISKRSSTDLSYYADLFLHKNICGYFKNTKHKLFKFKSGYHTWAKLDENSAAELTAAYQKYNSTKSEHKPNIDSPVMRLSDSYFFEYVGGNVKNTYSDHTKDKSGIRMKYKSTPHLVVSLNEVLQYTDNKKGYLYLCEVTRDPGKLRYGGNTPDAIKSNLWIPAGKPLSIEEKKIKWTYGDTWINKYECLKTYPFSFDDINQVTEIGSFYCESHINLDGRYDKNKESTSFYLSPTNFNLINPVYSQLDTFFSSRVMDEDYYKNKEYSNELMWTSAKNPGSDIDLWTNLHMANTYDLDGDNGKLNALAVFNDSLFGFQDSSISYILYNSRVQIQPSDGVPIEIANSGKLEGVRTYSNTIGCQDKFSVCTTPLGIYFIDKNTTSIYRLGDGLINLGLQLGTLSWIKDLLPNNTWKFSLSDKGNSGIRIDYDPTFQDVYFIPGILENGSYNDALCFSENLNQFTSFMSYGGAVFTYVNNTSYSFARDASEVGEDLILWKNFSGRGYNNIYNHIRPYSYSFISNNESPITKIFDTISFATDLYDLNTDKRENILDNHPIYNIKYTTGKEIDFSHKNQVGKPYDYIRVRTEYQDTGNVALTDRSFRKKFRIWRVIIPRDKGSRNRIVNPWCEITLGKDKPEEDHMITHTLSVHYLGGSINQQ